MIVKILHGCMKKEHALFLTCIIDFINATFYTIKLRTINFRMIIIKPLVKSNIAVRKHKALLLD